ncbi:sulfotransferase domain-containing protein [Algoriphagus vanfongensis]|uniref:sulfotransferase domain-containing protein n=1 Tax=Algoriphagus vanfongensis TaxID=426371 RepID=UPI000403C5B0|nr:sulfotransferase domain-containing protein [Algoriphagus vanfongensis]
MKIKRLFSRFILDLYKKKARGRSINVFHDDVFIVSYPKSGNTWVRFLLGNVLNLNYDFSNMESLIPDIYVVNNNELLKQRRPRILKSHEYFHPNYKKVIYIVRDPRSVAVSYYYYLKKVNKIPSEMQFKPFLKSYLSGSLDSYGSWSENVESWLSTKGNNENEFILIKYEDLLLNTNLEFTKILKFIDIDVSDEVIANSVNNSSFINMKKNEKLNSGNIKILNNSNENIAFVRKGEIDEWKDYFDSEDLDLLYYHFGKTMKKLDYV